MRRFDLLVIGSGPAGEKAAIQAAKLGKSVAVIEKGALVGGVSVHTGTTPSKTLRETVIYYNNLKRRSVYGIQLALRKDISVQELMYHKEQVVQDETLLIEDRFNRNEIEVLHGKASFADAHTLEVALPNGAHERLQGEVIVIATGTRPDRPTYVPFDERSIFDGETILQINRIPRTLTVVGGGVIGCEYASIFAHLGVLVTLLDSRAQLLHYLDREIVEALLFQMRKNEIAIHLNEKVESVEIGETGGVQVRCASGRQISSEKLLYAIGRVGNSDDLNLAAAGLSAGKRGLLEVNERYQTAIPHIYAVGDVIGFPSLASTAQDQGRIAMCCAFAASEERTHLNQLLPYALYTIPEIAYVGESEATLAQQGIPYEVGRAFYKNVTRGQIIAEPEGMIKLLFQRETLELLGVHIIGSGAAELIHVGQAILSFKGKITYFIDTVFNYPTLSEAYKTAALNGINRL